MIMDKVIRADKRESGQLRPIEINTGFTPYAEGSVLISMGNTKVLCNASVEETVPPWFRAEGQTGGWVTAEYSMLPRSTHTRNRRERHGPSGRSQEIQRLIGRALRASVNLELLGARTITIDCDVLQADGGIRTASITGGYVALRLALDKLVSRGELSDKAFGPAVAAISSGIVSGQPVLDLCYEEDSKAEVDANFVINDAQEIIEVQGTAEGKPFSRSDFDHLLDLSLKGVSELIELQRGALTA